MKTYEVTVICKVTKVYKVQAADPAMAREEAESIFSLDEYDENAIECSIDHCRTTNVEQVQS